MNIYNVRTQVRISGSFTDANGVSVDPTTVTLTLTSPDHGVQVIAAIRDGVGAYHVDAVMDATGVWEYRWQGDGAVIAASPVSLMQVL